MAKQPASKTWRDDENDRQTQSDFNSSERDRASAREMAGMKELARPSGYTAEPSSAEKGGGEDTVHQSQNSPPEHK